MVQEHPDGAAGGGGQRLGQVVGGTGADVAGDAVGHHGQPHASRQCRPARTDHRSGVVERLGGIVTERARDFPANYREKSHEIIAAHGAPDPGDPVFAYLGGEFTLPGYDAEHLK